MHAAQLGGKVRAGFWWPLGAVLAAVLIAAHLTWLSAPPALAGDSLATPVWMALAPVMTLAVAALGGWMVVLAASNGVRCWYSRNARKSATWL